MSAWSHEVALAAVPASVSQTRDFVAENLVAHDLAYLLDDVVLVSSELATNAVLHARTPFTVTLSGLDGALRLTVRDGSIALPIRTTSRDVDIRGHGHGLVLIERLSQAWGAAFDGAGSKVVWASFVT